MINKVAHRYSKAIFELAAEHKAVNSLINDMHSIRDIYHESEEFRSVVLSPVIHSDDKKVMLENTLLKENSGLQDLTKNLIRLLISKKRIDLLDDVCLSVINLDKIENNIVDAKIISAIQLDNKQISAVKGYLEKEFKKTVNIENLINESLIGGFRIMVGDVMIDNSISTHIAKLRQEMISG